MVLDEHMNTKDQLTPLVLTGTPHARGQAHGEALRSLIQELFGAWEEVIGRQPAAYLALGPQGTVYQRFELG